jgi:hypothetical protein
LGAAAAAAHLADGERLFEIGLHDANGVCHHRPLPGDGGDVQRALRIAPGARMVVDEQAAKVEPQGFAVALADEMQHQIQRGGRAAGGDPVAVDDEAVRNYSDARKFFLEGVELLPVNGGAIAVQQTGAGQQMAARVETSDDIDFSRFSFQQRAELKCRLSAVVVAWKYEQDVDVAQFSESLLGANLEPAGACHGVPVHRNQPPAVKCPPAERVGGPERFQGVGQTVIAESRQQQEGKVFGKRR